MKHTATPWYQNEDGDVCAKVEGIESVIADCLTHAIIGRHNYKENAEFIVRAVNSHDKVVKALECAKIALEDDPDCTVQYDIVCEALAAAKGE